MERQPKIIATLTDALAQLVGFTTRMRNIAMAPSIPVSALRSRNRPSKKRCEPAAWPDADEVSVLISVQKLSEASNHVRHVSMALGETWMWIADRQRWTMQADGRLAWTGGSADLKRTVAEAFDDARMRLGDLLPSPFPANP